MNGILLVGGGGHCRSVIDVLEKSSIPIAGIIQGSDCSIDSILGYPSLGNDKDLSRLRSKYDQALVTVGQIKTPLIRQKLFTYLLNLGFTVPAISSPFSYISPHSYIGEGTIIMHHSFVNVGVRIGDNCIVNTRAIIEHDCKINNHCHISVGTLLCGGVQIGSGTFVGAGSIIQQNIHIGNNCIIGMGCVVQHNIPDTTIYSHSLSIK